MENKESRRTCRPVLCVLASSVLFVTTKKSTNCYWEPNIWYSISILTPAVDINIETDISKPNVSSSSRHIDSSGHVIVGKTTTNLMVVPSGKGTCNKSLRIQLSSLGQWYTNPCRTCSDSLISVKRNCGPYFTLGDASHQPLLKPQYVIELWAAKLTRYGRQWHFYRTEIRKMMTQLIHQLRTPHKKKATQ